MIQKVYTAIRTNSSIELRKKARRFLRRRYYRALSYVEAPAVSITVLDSPREAIAGCMYRMKVQIQNRSRIVWNSATDHSPRFAAAAYPVDGTVIEDVPHTLLPPNFAPGSTADISLLFEVPRHPCALSLRIDLVREGCYWFSDIGMDCPELQINVVPHSNQLLEEQIPAVDLTLDVTNKCPLKCIQCRKTYFETFDEQQDMNFPLFEKIAKEAFPYSRSVSLSSAGEPLMTRKFLDAVSIARNYGLDVSFISSGMHLDHNRAEKLVDLGVARVEFSLDGASAEVYNKIRIGSNFDKVIKNISYLNEVKKRKKSRFPLLRFNFVLMRSNIHELPDFIRLAHRLGVEEVQTQHMVVFIDSLKDEALIFDKERSNRFVQEARKTAEHCGIRFYHPPLFHIEKNDQEEHHAEIHDGKIWMKADEYDFERVTHPNVPDGMQLCTDPWRKVFVDWQGMVYPCCVWKEAPMGDLTKNSFLEIWNSETYRNLRSGLTTGNLGKSCATCSVITGGDVDSERSYFFST